MSRASLVLLAVGVAALAGCGDARTRPPDLTTPATPVSYTSVRFPSAGIVLRRVPSDWRVQDGQSPLVATISSGEGNVAIWRYQRAQPLPASRRALAPLLTMLLGAVRARDPGYRVRSARSTSVDGHPAIERIGDATIDGSPRETRSTHVYAYGAELVFDAYTPIASFARSDRAVFVPLIASARLRRP